MPATTKTYSYDFGTTTASAKGGSMRDPITLANMDVDATIGGHISTSGESSKTYTCDCNLVIGASDTDTFFRIQEDETLVLASGKQLTIFLQAFRNDFEFKNSFWSRYGNDLPSALLGVQKSGIRKMFYKLQLTLGASGGLIPLVGSGASGTTSCAAPLLPSAGNSSAIGGFKLASVPPPAVEAPTSPVLVIEMVNAGVVPL